MKLSREYSILRGVKLLLSNNLDRLQKERFETNYSLAKAIGVHQTTIKNWKSGVVPQPRHLKAIAEHFGVTVDALLSDDAKTSSQDAG
jgi:transcriptional regulator with XRE-family HTH domain